MVASCADEQNAAPAVSTAASNPKFKIQTFLPEATQPAAGPAAAAPNAVPAIASDNAPTQANDPSAPLDTPLCGKAAREADVQAAAIAPEVENSGNACLQTACFDPATDTYIGADGFRHVCQ